MTAAFIGRISAQPFEHAADFGPFAVRGVARTVARREPGLNVELRHVAEGWGALRHDGVLCGHLSNFEELSRLRAQRRPDELVATDALELIRRLYEEYGTPAFRLLEGLFVGALWNPSGALLFASKTPGPTLYYAVDPDAKTVWVGSELKAFPRSLRRMRSLDELKQESAQDRARTTCLAGVLRVQSGHVVALELERQLSARPVRYYSVQRSIEFLEEAPAAARLRGVLTAAVTGLPGRSANCLISGGLDSSIVAALALSHFDSVRLFSLGSAERNEFDAAQKLSRRLGVDFERILIERDSFLRVLPELVYLLEHQHSTFIEYLLPVHLAHQRVGASADVLLSGYGSDVLFAGFAQRGDSLAYVTRLVEEEYESTAWSNEASQTLGGCLGMNVGYPFFHSEVVDASFAIDPRLKHERGIEKYILRRAFADLLGEEVAFRPKLGVHQGTGSEDYLTAVLGDVPAVKLRELKDQLCYEVLRVLLTENAQPNDVDARALVSRLTRAGLTRQPGS